MEIDFHQIRHRPLKRIFDLAFSFAVLLFLSPIFVVIALAVKLTSKGPIFYSHQRIGRGGRKFFCYKFRTMYNNAEDRLEDLISKDLQLANEWKATQKIKNDPRITPAGKFLRKTSLDEFPQFWNVLKGDLSVVGPRPVVHSEIVDHFGEKASKILSIRPGLTGIWQVSGRNDIPYSVRIELDERYVDTLSLLLDLKLIVKTIPVLISSKGAY